MAVARIYNAELQRNDESRHPCFVSDFKEKLSAFHRWVY